MSASHIIGNRNSTPETSTSNLRPPSSRASTSMAASHALRASADMSAFSATPARSMRPASEVYYNQTQHSQAHAGHDDVMEKEAQQWIADIDQAENTLEEMAAATLDQDFKDELSAIEQWFRVLSEAERTAALYALLQQTTQVQIRFFVGVLQQMAKSHPMSGMLSPANFGEKDPMSSRLSTAMNRLSVESNRNSANIGRPPPTTGAKRNSGLDPDEINNMFPDAAAAIAKQKADFNSSKGASNRNSAAIGGERNSLAAVTISTPAEDLKKDPFNQSLPSPSPWGTRASDSTHSVGRPKSSSGQQQAMGQFSQQHALRSPRFAVSNEANLQSTSLNAPEASTIGGLLSPYPVGASWASVAPTPMAANFSHQQSVHQADMVANATAMKLAALSTVNNRIQLDDVRKYRRSRSSEGRKTGLSQQISQGIHGAALPTNFIMTNELGQVLTPQQAASLQAQQLAAINGSRSRPTSPCGLNLPGPNFLTQGMHPNGYLSAYDSGTPMLVNGMAGLTVGSYGSGIGINEGYMSDASEVNRGRSPRGKRGSSKPPEDPTDMELLKDIPAWLRSLRLHKYTDNLKDLNWTELVQLDEEGLIKRGVNALGARRKMIKVFEQVREAQAQGQL